MKGDGAAGASVSPALYRRDGGGPWMTRGCSRERWGAAQARSRPGCAACEHLYHEVERVSRGCAAIGKPGDDLALAFTRQHPHAMRGEGEHDLTVSLESVCSALQIGAASGGRAVAEVSAGQAGARQCAPTAVVETEERQRQAGQGAFFGEVGSVQGSGNGGGVWRGLADGAEVGAAAANADFDDGGGAAMTGVVL